MNKPLLGEKVAVLIANGFCENDLTGTQRVLQKLGANVRIVSMDNGLVNAWNGEGWGLHYAADTTLNTALAVDFSILIVPGGQRSIEKLKLTAHTKRFISGFLNARKPVMVFGDALDLLVFFGLASGRSVAGPENLRVAAEQAGAQWSKKDFVIDANLGTGSDSDASREAYVKAFTDFILSGYAVTKAA